MYLYSDSYLYCTWWNFEATPYVEASPIKLISTAASSNSSYCLVLFLFIYIYMYESFNPFISAKQECFVRWACGTCRSLTMNTNWKVFSHHPPFIALRRAHLLCHTVLLCYTVLTYITQCLFVLHCLIFVLGSAITQCPCVLITVLTPLYRPADPRMFHGKL